jgi:hypothetical protein
MQNRSSNHDAPSPALRLVSESIHEAIDRIDAANSLEIQRCQLLIDQLKRKADPPRSVPDFISYRREAA